MSESKRVTLKRGREKRVFVIEPGRLRVGSEVRIKGNDPAPWTVSKIEDTEIIARIVMSAERTKL